MTKEAIHNEYLKQFEKAYSHRMERRALVLGVDYEHENIGMRICSNLNRGKTGVKASGKTHEDLAANDVARLASYMRIMRPDTLILCNGETHLNWIEDQDTDELISTINNSLTASILATQVFVQQTLQDDWIKYIVYIGSMAHRNVLNASSPYCAAKAGLAHFARCMGWELTPKGYRIFCVHPSNTEDTPMTKATIEGIMDYRNMTYDEAEDYWGSTKVMPWWLQKQDIAEVVEWLITEPSAEFLTGTQIELSGGQR